VMKRMCRLHHYFPNQTLVAVSIVEVCIGLEVARDFGGSHEVCKGNIVSVDSNRRRPLYHIFVWNT
jgi:hypothetical protein